MRQYDELLIQIDLCRTKYAVALFTLASANFVPKKNSGLIICKFQLDNFTFHHTKFCTF